MKLYLNLPITGTILVNNKFHFTIKLLTIIEALSGTLLHIRFRNLTHSQINLLNNIGISLNIAIYLNQGTFDEDKQSKFEIISCRYTNKGVAEWKGFFSRCKH